MTAAPFKTALAMPPEVLARTRRLLEQAIAAGWSFDRFRREMSGEV